jgi:hypothetical protein
VEEERVSQPTPALSPEFEQGNLMDETQVAMNFKKYTLIPGTTVLYESVPDPSGNGGDCVRIGEYSIDQPHTLVGAAVVVGSDSNVYVDVSRGTVYSSDGMVIGYFDRSALPKWENMLGAGPDSIVCDN